MTEAEWLECANPPAMLSFLVLRSGRNVSDRKLRLFGCACCRLIWHPPPDEKVQGFLVAVENHPAGPNGEPELWPLIAASKGLDKNWGPTQAWRAIEHLGWSYYRDVPFQSAITVGLEVAGRMRDQGVSVEVVRDVHSSLVRDIFTSPFRPVTLDPAWLTPAVRSLAQTTYDDRAFDTLPILGDALEEAGCTNPDILEHCRGPGKHVLGCWVLDLLLGKE